MTLQWRHFGVKAFQITGTSTVCPTDYSVKQKRKRQRLALLVPCVRETTMAGGFLSHKASYEVLYISFAVSVTKLLNKSWGVSDLGLHDVHASL